MSKLAYQIDSIEGLDEGLQGLYKEVDGKYQLAVDGLPEPQNEDVTGLKRKVEELLDEKKKEAAKRKEAEKAARKAAEERARNDGDVEAVEKTLRDHFGSEIETRDTTINTLSSQLNKLLVKGTAQSIAAELAVDTDALPILAEFVEHRLGMDQRDGEFTTIVKGDDGKPSGLSVDEFTASLRKNKALARLIKASDAAGGGAAGGKGSGAATQKADFGGSKASRIAALKAQFPELA